MDTAEKALIMSRLGACRLSCTLNPRKIELRESHQLLHLWTTSMHTLHKRLDCAAILVKVISPHRGAVAEFEDLGRKHNLH